MSQVPWNVKLDTGLVRDEGWGLSLGVHTTGLVKVSVPVHRRAECPVKGGGETSASPHFANASESLV